MSANCRSADDDVLRVRIFSSNDHDCVNVDVDDDDDDDDENNSNGGEYRSDGNGIFVAIGYGGPVSTR